MLLFALTVGGGIGAAILWVGRPQLVAAAIVIAVGAIGWGFTKARNPRPTLWTPPLRKPTLIFDAKPQYRSGFGCPRCPAAGFLAHQCADGTVRPGHFDHLAESMPLGIILPDPDDH